MLSPRLAPLAALILLATPASAAVIDSVNPAASPYSGPWVATEVGWFYTPAFAYDLTGVSTKFGATDGRTVTLEIYDNHPGSGGTLQRSADFSPLANFFTGGFFAPLTVTGGTTYFIGFRNVGGLGANVTNDPGATALPGGIRYSINNDGSYSNVEAGFAAQPLLLFHGEARSVPEPSTWALGLTTLAGLAWRTRVRRSL